MVVIILVGLGFGVGLAAIVWGLFPPPLTLRAALARLSGEHVTAPTDVLTQGVGGARRLCGHLLEINVRKVPQARRHRAARPRHHRHTNGDLRRQGRRLCHRARPARPGAVGGLGSSRGAPRRRAPCARGAGPRCPRRGHARSSIFTRQPNADAGTSATRSPPTPRWCRWPWPEPWGGRAHWRWPPPSRPPTGPWPRSPRACCGPRPTGSNLGRASSGWPPASTFPTLTDLARSMAQAGDGARIRDSLEAKAHRSG